MAKTSPTQRSLALMRSRGYLCAVTEHWNHFAKIRQDLFGIIDILCLGDNEVVGVQSTSASNISARVKKITDCEFLPAIRRSGIRLLVQGWKKTKAGPVYKEVDCS